MGEGIEALKRWFFILEQPNKLAFEKCGGELQKPSIIPINDGNGLICEFFSEMKEMHIERFWMNFYISPTGFHELVSR